MTKNNPTLIKEFEEYAAAGINERHNFKHTIYKFSDTSGVSVIFGKERMSGIFYNVINIDNSAENELTKEKVEEYVASEIVQRLSKSVIDLTKISVSDKLETDSKEYRTETAILSVEEYKRLKAIEKNYSDLRRYIDMYH